MRKLLRFTASFGVGTAICAYLLTAGWQLILACAILSLGLLCRKYLSRRQLLGAVLGLAAGILWSSLFEAAHLLPAEELNGLREEVYVELVDYPKETDYGASCTVRVLDPELRGRATLYGGWELMELEPGNRIRGMAKLKSVGQDSRGLSRMSRGVFLRLILDRRDKAWEDEGISGNTYREKPSGSRYTVEEGRAGSLRYLPQRAARRMQETIREIFPQPAAGLIKAMLTGERDDLTAESYRALRESGLLHVTAVSGLHCGFLILLMGLFVLGDYRLTAIVGCPVLLFYMVMVGCTPSVVRAAIMVSLYLLAPLLGRESDAPTSLGAALFVILLGNPYAIASVGLQLSFASVAGLLVLSPKIYKALAGEKPAKSRTWRGIRYFVVSSLASSLGVLAMTAPLSALYFHYLPLASPLSNLLALWCAPFLFGFALLAVGICMLFPGLGWLGLPAELLARYLLRAAGLTAKIPGQGVVFNGLLMVMWLLWVYGMLLICMGSGARRGAYFLTAVLALVGLQAARALPAYVIRDDRLTAMAVDVGQGASTVLISGEDTGLVDCGSLYKDAGTTAADALKTLGRDKLSWVALTHYHKDHAGGLGELLAQIPVERLILPQLHESTEQSALQKEVEALALAYQIPVTYVGERTEEPFGESTMTFFPPLTTGEINEEGLTALCTAGDFDLLITGDMGVATERRLIERYTLPDIEVLFVGHHGSRYATSEELLKDVWPEVGVISVGENSFGHPSPEAMDRCAFRGMTLYRTDMQGSILVRVHH